MSGRLAENPFLVLGVKPDCSRIEAEREGMKILGMLELGLAEGLTYRTPSGPRKRDADLVRRAMAEMADPEKRLVHELLARNLPEAVAVSDAAPARPWADAFRALGWKRGE